jgi:hypothetical protein
MDRLIYEGWSADDMIELTVDEVSVAGSVGSGTDRRIGSHLRYGFDDKLEKIFKEYEEFLARSKERSTPNKLREFGESRGLPESLAKRLVERMKR